MLLQKGLAPVINPMNSILIEKKFVNVDTKFIQLVSIAENLPRTTVIESVKITGKVFVEVLSLDFQMI